MPILKIDTDELKRNLKLWLWEMIILGCCWLMAIHLMDYMDKFGLVVRREFIALLFISYILKTTLFKPDAKTIPHENIERKN